MNRLRLGVEISSGENLAALVESTDVIDRIVALGRTSCGDPFPDSFGPDAVTTIAVPDRQAIVRVVDTAPVEISLVEKAARFELTSSLLESATEFLTVAHPIATEKKNAGTPDRWLTAAVRRSRFDETEKRLFGETRRANVAQLTTRSIALGTGFLRFCEPPAEPAAVVISPSNDSTAICFLGDGCVVGTADLRGLPNDRHDVRRIAGWLSELQTLVQFRLGTDLAIRYSGVSPSLIVAAEDDIAAQLAALSSAPIVPAVLKSEYLKVSVGGTPVSMFWLVALGAAVN